MPTNAELKVTRALEVFNPSQHPRTVRRRRALARRAVGRSRARGDDGSLVAIVVGWELCWYRYEVDLADEAAASA